MCDAILELSSSGESTDDSMSEPKRENSGSATFSFLTSAPVEMTFRRSLRVLNSNCSKRAVRSSSATPDHANSSMENCIGASWINCVSSRFRITLSILARSDSPTFPATLSALASNSLSEPYSMTHLAAVFSPTPGMDGRLSLGSPRRAAKSGY